MVFETSKIQKWGKGFRAKYLRSNVIAYILPISVGTLLSGFVFYWGAENVKQLREQTKDEIYSNLRVVENQLNMTIKSELSRVAMAASTASNILSRNRKVPPEILSKVADADVQFWQPNRARTELKCYRHDPISLEANLPSSSKIDTVSQALVVSTWKRLSNTSGRQRNPKAVLEESNLSLSEGQAFITFAVPIVLEDGTVGGVACSRQSSTKIRSLLPENTFLVDTTSGTSLGRSDVTLSPGSLEQFANTGHFQNEYFSAARHIQVSKFASNWQVWSDHSISELWSKPEIKRIIDLHGAIIVTIWLTVFFLIKSSKRAKNRQRALIGSLIQKVIWITNEDGNIDHVLGKIASQLGWKVDDYIDVNICLFVHQDDREILEKAIANAASKISSDEILEVRFENKDREFRWYEVSVSNMTTVPEINGIVVTAHDIEQRIHATAHILASKRAAEKANEAKSDFLSRMSHELRTPLNAILGFGQLLEMEAITARQSENVEQILIAGRHLLGLVNDILDIARIETRKVNLSVERVNVREVLEESFALLSPLAAKSKVTLEMSGDECPDIWSDRQRLKQIVLNLLSNGIKYNNPEGYVRVSITQVDENLKVKVADNGIGIESHYLERVFTPFDRLGSDNAQIEGSGLGLALSKTLVDAMGASLEVSSEYGKGSIFTVTFKATSIIREELATATQEEDDEMFASFGNSNDFRVLLIEDNIVNLRYISKVIDKMDNVALMSAKEGGIGIELARSHNPDLILLDLDLPDINGKDVLKCLRDDIITKDSRIVVMSAETNPHVVEELLRLGANDFVTKPVDVNSLFHLFTEENKAA
jgi:PAS domain S-box-containing protein